MEHTDRKQQNKTKQKNFAPYFQALDKYENKSV